MVFVSIFIKQIRNIQEERRKENEKLQKELHDKNLEHQRRFDEKVTELKLKHDETVAKTEEERIKLKNDFEKENAQFQFN